MFIMKHLTCALLLLALTGCSATHSNKTTNSESSNTRLTAKIVEILGEDIQKVRIMVSGKAIPTATQDFTGKTGGTIVTYSGSDLIVSASAFNASNSLVLEGFVTGVTVEAGVSKDVSIPMSQPVFKDTDKSCISCHETTRDATGQNLIADYKQSGHYTNISWDTNKKNGSTFPGCAGCHGTQHNDPSPSASGRCWECHGSNFKTNHQNNGSATSNCTSCHQAHKPKNATGMDENSREYYYRIIEQGAK